jgi:anti-sigma B factor antagonist
MSDPSWATLMVMVDGQTACVKISGRANFTSSVDFKTLLNELREKGSNCYILDLTDCVLMDSTFLGVLSGFAVKLSGGNGNGRSGRIELFNPNTRITEILENLGVLHLFHVAKTPAVKMDTTRTFKQESANATRQEVTSTCLEAHKALMAINPENIARFKDVTEFMAEDLKKMKSGS